MSAAADLNAQVDGASQAIRKLPELAEATLSLANTRAGALVLVLALAWFVFRLLTVNWLPLLDLLERKRKQRLAHLDAYVGDASCADKATLEIVRDVRDAMYFHAAVGIYAEKSARAALIKLHQKSPAVITWRRISRSSHYIEIDSDPARIRFSRFDQLGYWYNAVFGVVLLLGGLGLMVATFAATFFRWQLGASASSIAIGTIAFAFGLFVLAQNLPMRSAKMISNELQALSAKERHRADRKSARED